MMIEREIPTLGGKKRYSTVGGLWTTVCINRPTPPAKAREREIDHDALLMETRVGWATPTKIDHHPRVFNRGGERKAQGDIYSICKGGNLAAGLINAVSIEIKNMDLQSMGVLKTGQ